MNYLIVAAHPDDEVLGAGATMYKLARDKLEVSVCILSGNVQARMLRPRDEELKDDIDTSMGILQVKKYFLGEFPNIRLNTVPHIELVQFVEKAIVETKAEVISTHHPGDLNNDHLHTSLACQEAVRLFQRRTDVTPIRELLFMEVLSATDWRLNEGMNAFTPNIFIEIGEEALEKKIEALSGYRDVMRPYPHPRSAEALRGLAACRGAQAGLNYAEAFQSVFRRGF